MFPGVCTDMAGGHVNLMLGSQGLAYLPTLEIDKEGQFVKGRNSSCVVGVVSEQWAWSYGVI